MNSLLKKRLPGILVAGLVTLAVGAAGVTPAATASDATTSALTKAQKRAKAKALKSCKKKKKAKQRKACVKRVNKRFKRLARKPTTPSGKTWSVDVADPYVFLPSQLDIKVNDSILWNWKKSGGREPHDVTPVSIPAGLNRYDYKSQLTSSTNYTFKAKFVKPGAYSFVCSLHFQMTMDVNVSR